MHNFQELLVWQKAMAIAEEVYLLSISSCNEMFTQLELAHRLKSVHKDKVTPILNNLIEVQKINYSLINKFSK